MNQEEMFNQLVDNAFDFLFRAVSEVEDHPKYSVMHFYAAVELFIKARLMKEHWSLVVSQRQEADWDKFIAGDFQSVTLIEAARRLEKVVRSKLSESEIGAFRAVANDRNKMVHFFHEAHAETNENLRRGIIRKQMKAWYSLHQLLKSKWKDEFRPWSDKTEELDIKLKGLHEFLQATFDNLKPQIDENKENGSLYGECPSCRFESQELIEDMKKIHEAKCLVCGLVERVLNIQCPECEEPVMLRQEGFGQCQSCGRHFGFGDVAKALTDDSVERHRAKLDGDDSWDDGNCGDCGSDQTVVRTENNEWICVSCFGVFEFLQPCRWCNRPNTDDMSDSYITGCNQCGGMLESYMDG